MSSRSLRLHRNAFCKAANRTLVAHSAIALNFDFEQQRIIVAVGRSLDHAKTVAARLALHPQLLPRPAPERNEPGLKRLRITHLIQEAEHQHLTRLHILNDTWDQAIHLCKINLHSVNHFYSSWVTHTQQKSPLAVFALAGLSKSLVS